MNILRGRSHQAHRGIRMLRHSINTKKTEISRQIHFVKTRLCRSRFLPSNTFLLRRLQRVQFAAASFVLGHYVKNFRDVLKIGWLPINERRDLNLLK